jgi:hypothetical protein
VRRRLTRLPGAYTTSTRPHCRKRALRASALMSNVQLARSARSSNNF